MKLHHITQLQKEYELTEIQDLINSGLAWKLEGSVGRFAMQMLETGACMLPTKAHFDAYGNRVPSRNDLKKGTKGTLQNSQMYWTVQTQG